MVEDLHFMAVGLPQLMVEDLPRLMVEGLAGRHIAPG